MKRNRRFVKRIGSTLLAVCLTMNILPMSVIAYATDNKPVTVKLTPEKQTVDRTRSVNLEANFVPQSSEGGSGAALIEIHLDSEEAAALQWNGTTIAESELSNSGSSDNPMNLMFTPDTPDGNDQPGENVQDKPEGNDQPDGNEQDTPEGNDQPDGNEQDTPDGNDQPDGKESDGSVNNAESDAASQAEGNSDPKDISTPTTTSADDNARPPAVGMLSGQAALLTL